MNAQRTGSLPRIGAALAVLFLVAACGSRTGDLGTVAPPSSQEPSLDVPTSEPTPGGASAVPSAPAGPSAAPATPRATPGVPGETPTPTEAGTTTVRAYFFLGSFVDNAGLVPVLREIPRTQAVGAAAMRALLSGPNDAELGARPAMYTTVPDGTRFLGLKIDAGVATVNLSREFEQGGGSASVLGRLAQVVYTLTQFPTVEAVKFELDGEPVTVFSGQGVVLDAPVDRADYADQLPAVFVDRPAWGGVLSNPGRITGLADVFEATFQARVLDGAGRSLVRSVITASCGTGCLGTFDATLPYDVAKAGWGTLQVSVQSAADGSEQDLTEYPVWLTP